MTAPALDDAKDELRRVGRELSRVNGRADRLFARRLELFQELAAASVPYVEIARLAGTTKQNVNFALHKARRNAG